MAPAKTGITAISKKAVMSHVQTNIGIFMSVMPGARMFKMVTMMLMEPMMEEAPKMCNAKMAASIEGPI